MTYSVLARGELYHRLEPVPKTVHQVYRLLGDRRVPSRTFLKLRPEALCRG